MSKFIKLTQKAYDFNKEQYNYDTVYVNVDNIACFGGFGIMFVSEGSTQPLAVKETPEEIAKLIAD